MQEKITLSPLEGGTITLTQQDSTPTYPDRQAGAEIEVTPEMIDAGVAALQIFCESPSDLIVEAVYTAMERQVVVGNSRKFWELSA